MPMVNLLLMNFLNQNVKFCNLYHCHTVAHHLQSVLVLSWEESIMPMNIILKLIFKIETFRYQQTFIMLMPMLTTTTITILVMAIMSIISLIPMLLLIITLMSTIKII
ncbi:hypothetical protein MG5_01309 [Candida albicans P57072]|uniref:Uncharacterized protein n=1 Tax=Candida albicans P78048 TaxID=1094989 RepID=A0AB34PZ83_CANAX|nr:hypothetical protein MEO_01314 [Candida albicans P94015]KGR02111.1 hypothetical protein MG1_01326 [Candida albicans GC75]KGR14569.1 hypothetical protein MG5_01309 [Candida albicans P57072]KGR16635.1 hypothetical protein MG3_01364 [Candida albicans P78048]KGT71795.1 hypothetical protein MEK_01343 [Candida albicans 12C]KGU30559.1 hypothetical protein MG7_01322 [Candida albicans P34048]KGU37134.1 putative RNA-binding protein [Candida albicans P57055]KHC41345.1 putative RNA-binding protein [C